MSKRVREYFSNTADKFDKLYSGERRTIQKIIDRFFRQGVTKRIDLVFRECNNLSGKKILDVGCGSGRYCIEFAKRGARKVVGIDYAKGMINLAIKIAAQSRVDHICEFFEMDIADYSQQDKFDISIAMGVFDYVKEPAHLIAKMREITSQKMLLWFPAKWHYKAPLRIISLGMQNCPVYFFSIDDIKKILKNVGITNYNIEKCSGNFFVTVNL